MYTVLCKGKIDDDRFRLYRNCDTYSYALRLCKYLNNKGIDSIIEQNFYVKRDDYEKETYRWK